LLVVFFTADEGRRERQKGNHVDHTREAVRRAIRNEDVAALVNRAFVPVAADFKLTRPLQRQLGGGIQANQVVIARPDLTVLDKLDVGRASNSTKLLEALEKSLAAWMGEIYARDVAPVLRDAEASPQKIKKALASALRFGVDEADEDVIALLGRERLDSGVRVAAFGALAKLSTDDAVRELMRQAESQPVAFKELQKCHPRALPTLVTYLDGEPVPEFLRAYRATCIVARARPKPDAFWPSASAEEREKEVERIKAIVAKKAP
jgi:hypothetical protein